MDSNKRVIYAPIRRGAASPAGAEKTQASRDSALKYLDESSSDSEPAEKYAERLHRHSAELAGSKRPTERRSGGGGGGGDHEPAPFAGRSQLERRLEGAAELQESPEESDGEPRDQLEEVYLCSCCGTTKELEPAMRYLPVFRSLLVLFNLLALALGLANLGLGLWLRIDPKVNELQRYIETRNFSLAGWLMLAGGSTGALVALFAGCAGLARKSACLLVFYALSMAILGANSIGTLVLLTVYGLGDSLERFLTKEVYDQIRRRTMADELAEPAAGQLAAQFMDFVQVKLRCCGAQDFRDYQRLGQAVPTTCYTIAANFVAAPGCGPALRELFDLRAGLAASATAAGALVQILASLLAGLMVCAIYNYRATARPASALSMAGQPRSGRARPSGSPDGQLEQPVNFKRVVRNYPAPGATSPARPLSRASSIEV